MMIPWPYTAVWDSELLPVAAILNSSLSFSHQGICSLFQSLYYEDFTNRALVYLEVTDELQ